MSSTAGATGTLLWGRALVLSAVALGTGTLAHLGAHGLLPGPVAMLALLLVGTAVAAPLLRTESSRARVVVMLALGQTAVHGALTALAGHRGEEHVHGVGPEWVEHLVSDLSGAHALMALAHAAAAGVVGLWLAAGERALWALLREAGSFLGVRLLTAPPAVGRPRVVPTGAARGPSRTSLLASVQRRRGPPRWLPTA